MGYVYLNLSLLLSLFLGFFLCVSREVGRCMDCFERGEEDRKKARKKKKM